MAQTTQEQPHVGPVSRAEERLREAAVSPGGTAAEAIGGAAAVVLSIIGLAGGLPRVMMAIATIVLGGAILLVAAGISARYERLVHDTWGGEARVTKAEVGTGLSGESLAGIAGIVLGILALLGFVPETLCSIALIGFGGGMLLACMARRRFHATSVAHYGAGASQTAMRALSEASSVGAGGDLLIGAGAVVLGILALLGLFPLTLVFIGFLGVGGALMLGGRALGTKMLHFAHPGH